MAYVGLAKDINLYLDQRGIVNAPRVNDGLALAWYILFFCTFIPYLGILFGIAYIVILLILMNQFTEASKKILEYKAAQSVGADMQYVQS